MNLVRDKKNPCVYRERKKPQEKAIEHAKRAAELGAQIHECPYRDKRWRGVWIKAFATALQQDLFPIGGGGGRSGRLKNWHFFAWRYAVTN